MQLVIAASSAQRLAPWRDVLGDLKDVEFRTGTMPEVGFGCDAQILPAFLAHDRYGGTPRTDQAQILENLRGDGGPDLIIATPAYAPTTRPVEDQALTGERLLGVFRACLAEAEERKINSILILVMALGLDGVDPTISATALRHALVAP